MYFSQPVTDLIRQRSSCRGYQRLAFPDEVRLSLEACIASLGPGPFGSANRFSLASARDGDQGSLRGLGTYGAIRNPAAFIIGTSLPGAHSLEDFGYQMEYLVLKAADLGLGSCWLGGNFTRSSFSQRIAAVAEEIIPAVVSLGLPLDSKTALDQAFRVGAGSDRRYPWEVLFFNGAFGAPLSREDAGNYALPLEMLRLGPSASNKQPWRVLKDSAGFHFYMQRTPGYPGGLVKLVLGVADMQRLDMGIAMCHFALTCAEAGLAGRWALLDPKLLVPDAQTHYYASWVPG